MRLFPILRKRPSDPVDQNNRDTDRDWQQLGDSEPYWGVLTNERFRRENLSQEAKAEFMASGTVEIDGFLAAIRQHFGDFTPRSALDFGCGVGRLTAPLAELTGDAVGVDVSDGMLNEARSNVTSGVHFMKAKPDRLFDWIVSIIVFQHIPPDRGYEILADLVRSISPGGCLTMQFAIWRDKAFEHTAGTRIVVDGGRAYPAVASRVGQIETVGHISMFDYDLGLIVAILVQAGIQALHMFHTDHGGFHGVCIIGRKSV